MVNIQRSWLSSSLLALSLLAPQALSVVFEAVDAPGAVRPLLGRGDQSNDAAALSIFDRLSKDSYYWSGSQNGHKTLANLTVDVGEDEANIVSMEKFRHLLKSVNCTDNGMVVEFDDTRAFNYTQNGWQWVNDDDDRKLILIMGSKHCGWNPHRMPFLVSSIVFDKRSLKAKLSGVASDWKQLFSNYEMTVGKHPEADSSPSRRDWDAEASLSFKHKIPLNKSFPVGKSLSIDLTCEECETKGSFDFGVHIKTSTGIPESASLTLSPNGVSAQFTPRLGLSGNMTDDYSDEFELVKIPVEGFSIPGGVLDLGPEIVFSFGYEIGKVKGTAGVTSGVTLSLQDSAELEIDFLAPDVSAGGWTPQLETHPLTIDAKIEASAEIYTKAEVQFAASFLDQGYEAGVNLRPYLGADIAVGTDQGVGVDLNLGSAVGANIAAGGAKACATPKAGVSLNVDVANVDTPDDPLVEKKVAEVTVPMSSSCFRFGPTGSIQLGGDKKPTPTPSQKAPRPSMTHTPAPSKARETLPKLSIHSKTADTQPKPTVHSKTADTQPKPPATTSKTRKPAPAPPKPDHDKPDHDKPHTSATPTPSHRRPNHRRHYAMGEH